MWIKWEGISFRGFSFFGLLLFNFFDNMKEREWNSGFWYWVIHYYK